METSVYLFSAYIKSLAFVVDGLPAWKGKHSHQRNVVSGYLKGKIEGEQGLRRQPRISGHLQRRRMQLSILVLT